MPFGDLHKLGLAIIFFALGCFAVGILVGLAI